MRAPDVQQRGYGCHRTCHRLYCAYVHYSRKKSTRPRKAKKGHHLLALQSARAATCLGHPLPACPSRGRRRKAVRAASPLQPRRVFRLAAVAPCLAPRGRGKRAQDAVACHPLSPAAFFRGVPPTSPLAVLPSPVLWGVSSPSASCAAPARAPGRSGGAATPREARGHTPGEA